MTETASRPDPAATDRTWTVVVNMPVHGTGKKAGQPVGWQSLNNLPSGVPDKIWWDKAKKAWRLAAYSAIVNAGVPQHLGRIEVGIELRFTETRDDRNAENFEYTIKPIIDALTKQRTYTVVIKNKPKLVIELGRHIVPGDDERYLVRAGRVTIGPPLGRKSKVRGQVILTIRQLPQETR
jgi:hypothetical protein